MLLDASSHEIKETSKALYELASQIPKANSDFNWHYWRHQLIVAESREFGLEHDCRTCQLCRHIAGRTLNES